MVLLSLLYYIFIQTLGLLIAFAAAAVLLYILLRRFNSRTTTVLLVVMFLGISLFFYVPNGLPKGLEYPSFLTTYGPGAGPRLPFANVLRFFINFNNFDRVNDIARDPKEVSVSSVHEATSSIAFSITAKEVVSEVAEGIFINYWTFDGKVPGPFLRVREGDNVTIHFKNDSTSLHTHSIDFHAVEGPGGGAAILSAKPGETKTLHFRASRAGIYVYHCANPNVANHMAHGQYGLILVEPKAGLPKVDKEFYVMQGEFYTTGTLGKRGLQIFDATAMLDGHPQYIVFNGRTGALTSTSTHSMTANVGDTVRIYFGNGGVNLISSFHVIGTIFSKVYMEGSLVSAPLKNVQTTLVPAGGATAVEFTVMQPGSYVLVDHALARIDRGAWGVLHVSGEGDKSLFDGISQEMKGH